MTSAETFGVLLLASRLPANVPSGSAALTSSVQMLPCWPIAILPERVPEGLGFPDVTSTSRARAMPPIATLESMSQALLDYS